MEVFDNIAAVELSRIAGYKYPDDDVELKQLQSLFATPLHIASGDIVYTPPVAIPHDHVLKSGLFDSTELGFHHYFVKHIKLETRNSTESNEARRACSNSNGLRDDDGGSNGSERSLELDALRRSIKKSGRVTERSAVTLQGKTNHFLLTSGFINDNNAFSNVVMRNGIDSGSENCTMDYGNRSTCLLSNSISDLSAVYQNILRLANFKTIEHEDTLIGAFHCSDQSRHVSNGNINHVMPYTVSDGTIFGLIASPLLIESPCGEEGIATDCNFNTIHRM